MSSIDSLRMFLSRYDRKKDLNFSRVSFFPNTKVIQPFGIGAKNQELIFHTGTSFGKQKTFFYDTYTPFDFESVEYLEDKDILILHSSFGFSVRIHHIKYESLTEEFWKALDDSSPIPANTKIGKSGKLHYYTPFEAFIEIYTEESDNLFSSLLQIRFNSCYNQEFSFDTLKAIFDIYSIDHTEGMNQIQDIQRKESISFMNSFFCKKYDSLLEKEIFLYSYTALF